ncbi:MAG: outer membrane beta-barrel protein [Sphingobium sp.]
MKQEANWGYALAVLCSVWSGAAVAQLQGTVVETSGRGANTGVLERARPEYDSPGLYTGAFLVQPEIEVETGYTDNAYLTRDNKVSDGFVYVNPKMRINSTWSRHALAAELGVGLKRYLRETVRDEEDYSALVRGRYDMGGEATLTGAGRFVRRYESQYNIYTVDNAASTIPVNDIGGTLVAAAKRGRFRFSLSGIVGRLDYSDYTTIDGDRVSQESRDRSSYAGAAQVDYEISPSAAAFVQVGYEQLDYDDGVEQGIQNRNSKAYRIMGGTSFDLSKLMRGRIGAGYIRRKYDGSVFDPVSGFTVEGKIEYFPSQLTTFTLDVHRVVEDSTVSDLGGFFRTGGDIRVDHELLRNLLLNATGSFEYGEYQERRSKVHIWQVGAGASYLANRHISADFGVNYGERDSNDLTLGDDFKEFRLNFAVHYRI